MTNTSPRVMARASPVRFPDTKGMPSVEIAAVAATAKPKTAEFRTWANRGAGEMRVWVRFEQCPSPRRKRSGL